MPPYTLDKSITMVVSSKIIYQVQSKKKWSNLQVFNTFTYTCIELNRNQFRNKLNKKYNRLIHKIIKLVEIVVNYKSVKALKQYVHELNSCIHPLIMEHEMDPKR